MLSNGKAVVVDTEIRMDQTTIDTYDAMAAQYDAETVGFWDEFPRSFIDSFAGCAKGKVLNV